MLDDDLGEFIEIVEEIAAILLDDWDAAEGEYEVFDDVGAAVDQALQ